MQAHSKLEISVGAFVVMGALAIGYLSLSLGRLAIGGPERYSLVARFSSVGSLKSGQDITLKNCGRVDFLVVKITRK